MNERESLSERDASPERGGVEISLPPVDFVCEEEKESRKRKEENEERERLMKRRRTDISSPFGQTSSLLPPLPFPLQLDGPNSNNVKMEGSSPNSPHREESDCTGNELIRSIRERRNFLPCFMYRTFFNHRATSPLWRPLSFTHC